jgi:hypothetical protein
MAAVFRNVVPVVGNKLYYIASDDSVTCSISSLVSSRGITNTYVNPDFLSDDLMKMKSEELVEIIDRNTRQNTLLFPIACFHFQNYRLTMENQQRIPSLVLLIVVFLFPLFTVRRTNLVMYGSAGALAGFEIIMLLVLQSSAGNMYQFTGIILAGFMAGLALGSGTDMPPLRWIGKFSGSGILILFYICIAFLISRLISINSVFLITSIILFLSLIPAFITGRLFRIMTEKGIKGSESSVYSSDMAGAALGFIAVSGIAIPLAGIRMTLFLLSFLILAGVLFGTVRDK